MKYYKIVSNVGRFSEGYYMTSRGLNRLNYVHYAEWVIASSDEDFYKYINNRLKLLDDPYEYYKFHLLGDCETIEEIDREVYLNAF